MIENKAAGQAGGQRKVGRKGEKRERGGEEACVKCMKHCTRTLATIREWVTSLNNYII